MFRHVISAVVCFLRNKKKEHRYIIIGFFVLIDSTAGMETDLYS